jgi:hypothetical protein
MYYLINVDHNGMAVHPLTKSDCYSNEKCCISNAVDKTGDDMLPMAVNRIGIFGVSVRTMKALTVKKETVTLIRKG